MSRNRRRSLRALECSNFFLADVQTGLGPMLAAYLAGQGWTPAQIGYALTIGGIVTVGMQTPAGALVDRIRQKRAVLILACMLLAGCAVALLLWHGTAVVYGTQILTGAAAPFLGPTLAAITLGLVGPALFDRQFGRNQSFNSAGNVVAAVTVIALTHVVGDRAIFYAVLLFAAPTVLSILSIAPGEIDFNLARGGCEQPVRSGQQRSGSVLLALAEDRALLAFLACAFLFHFANAAMLPQLGEMLAHGHPAQAESFMSACIVVTQIVIAFTASTVGRLANTHGRKPLLLIGFGVLPVRALLYAVLHRHAPLVAVQVLDGVANSIFGVVSILVIADRTRGSGRFNLGQGVLATCVGLGAALSNTYGGKLIERFGFTASFLGLGAVALAALLLLWLAVPETLHAERDGILSLHK